jgi:hypothetical protein
MEHDALSPRISGEDVAGAPRVFAENAQVMAQHGLAVIPIARNREPYVIGFNRWSRPPGRRALDRWAQQYPRANIAVVPGLSGVMVADVDNANDVPAVEGLLGATPLRTRTRRGMHLWYAKPDVRLPGDLRKYGLDVDLKAGANLVIAPPSIHESGVAYALDDGCDWTALRDVVQPMVNRLQHLVNAHAKEVVVSTSGHREMRDGSRGQWLNDRLCRHAAACANFEEMMDVAMTLKQELAKRGLEPLDDEEVFRRTQKVWQDAQDGKLESWVGREGVARLTGREMQALCELDARTGPDAYTLLAHLRVSHSLRCRRGETFSITPKAMSRHNVIPGWGRERYERARDLLLLAGLIMLVTPFSNTAEGRRAAQYTLAVNSAGGAGAV